MKCEVCGASVHELRRGRCWGCYNRWVDTRPVGVGASCILCGERRRDVLRSIELLGSWQVSCHNCAARIAALIPVPQSLDDIRNALRRERRTGERRAQTDASTGAERRQGDRRQGRMGDETLHICESAQPDPLPLKPAQASQAHELAIGESALPASAAPEDTELTRILDLGASFQLGWDYQAEASSHPARLLDSAVDGVDI